MAWRVMGVSWDRETTSGLINSEERLRSGTLHFIGMAFLQDVLLGTS